VSSRHGVSIVVGAVIAALVSGPSWASAAHVQLDSTPAAKGMQDSPRITKNVSAEAAVGLSSRTSASIQHIPIRLSVRKIKGGQKAVLSTGPITSEMFAAATVNGKYGYAGCFFEVSSPGDLSREDIFLSGPGATCKTTLSRSGLSPGRKFTVWGSFHADTNMDPQDVRVMYVFKQVVKLAPRASRK
jgi:hypothetical protein